MTRVRCAFATHVTAKKHCSDDQTSRTPHVLHSYSLPPLIMLSAGTRRNDDILERFDTRRNNQYKRRENDTLIRAMSARIYDVDRQLRSGA